MGEGTRGKEGNQYPVSKGKGTLTLGEVGEHIFWGDVKLCPTIIL